MATAVNMPQIGQDIEKGLILEWYFSEGDPVEQGDIIATVESDKAVFEVEAFETGTLIKIIHQEGEEAEVFKPIAWIGTPDETIEEKVPAVEKDLIDKSEITVNELPKEVVIERRSKIFASPTAKRMARDHNLNLKEITGSGPNGRIVKRDILPLIEGVPSTGITKDAADQVIPFSPMRKRIAERLSYSKQNIPHFYLYHDANVSKILEARIKYNENSKTHLSINDLIVYASVSALKQFRRLNSHVEEDKLIIKGNVNIGLAVSVEDGLLVPVLRDADRKNLDELSQNAKDIINRALEGKMAGGMPGTFTISNLGMYGISRFQAIINPPESAILTVGNINRKVIPVNGGFGFADFITLGLACDHRVIDGVYGAKFLKSLAHELENINIE